MIREALHIVTDPGHMIAEFLSEGLFFLLGVGYVKYKLYARDKEHQHAVEV